MKNFKFAALLAPALFLGVPLCGDPSSAFGDDSHLTGIAIPRSGESFRADNDHFTSFLKELAQDEAVKMTPAGDEAEVFIWQGDNHRQDRAAFVQTMVRKALVAAGYAVKEIDQNELRGVNVFAHLDVSDETLQFRPTTAGRPTIFFRATNEAQGKSVIGAWIESDKAMTLSLLPIAFKATPKAKPLPGVAGNGILISNIDDTMASLPRPPLPQFPALARRPRMVRGWLKDAAGRPVVNAEVSVFSSMGGGVRTTHRARSNAQGLYQVLVPTGVAEVAQVDTDVSMNGQKFNLHLEPVSGAAKQFNSQTGHVENYVLRTTGKAGGTLRVLDGLQGGMVEITVTPVGRSLDGSVGRPLVYRFSNHGETFINGLPLGRYTLTARLLDEGEVLPLRVGPSFGSDAEREPKDKLDVKFRPGFSYIQSNVNKGNSNVVPFEVMLAP